jgi:hypothetical protein
MTSVQLKGSGYDLASSKAFWLAEAGLQKYIYLLKNDENYRSNYPDLNESLGNGSYLVQASYDVGSNTYTLISTGTVGVLNRKLQQSVVVTSSGGYPGGSPEAFEYCMHSFGTNTKFNDSTGTINGDVAATNKIQGEEGMTINGTITEGSSVTSPSPVDMDSYEDIADHVESGGFTFAAGQTYTGIYYINGKTTIEDNVTINGSVIAENNISMGSSGISIDADSGYPALISGNNIQGDGLQDSTISGLIFATNNVDFDNLSDVTINGTILSDNNTLIRDGDSFTINYDSDIVDNPPPYFQGYVSSGVTVTPQRDWNEIVPAI